MADQWVRRWKVTSFTDASKSYTVAQRAGGDYGCSCPAWVFSRQRPKPDCKHIEDIKDEVTYQARLLARVAKTEQNLAALQKAAESTKVAVTLPKRQGRFSILEL